MHDSGERRQFETGAVRDRGADKPRPDLISPHANLREGAWLAKGAEKYSPRNWEKGMPISECVASLVRHIEAYKLGRTDEDHMAAIRTNAGFILHYEEEIKAGRLPATLDDMPHYATPQPGDRRVVNGVEERYVKWTDPENRMTREVLKQMHFAAPDSAIIEIAEMVRAAKDGECVEIPRTFTGLAGEKVPCRDFTVYLCGPITGEMIDHEWRLGVRSRLEAYGIRVLDPMRGKDVGAISNQGMNYEGQAASTEMADRDHLDVEEADVVLAYFPYTPPRQSIGSLMEMGMAANAGTPIVLCAHVPEFNEHLFCRRWCDIQPTIGQAVDRIIAMAKEA